MTTIKTLRASLTWGNVDLAKLCREVLHEVSEGQSELITGPAAQESQSDIYIWDYAPGRQLPAWVREGNLPQHLFLVSRQDLEAFRAVAPQGAANVLLKPLGRPTLLAFLSQPGFQNATAQPAAGTDLASEQTLGAERDEVLQCVIQANLKLQEYDQERTNFLARTVHDFRAPLTAVCGYCSLLGSGKVGELTHTQQDTIERIHASADRLTRLVEALLQLSSGHHRERRPDYQEGDLQERADQVARELMSSLDRKNISVAVNLTAGERALHFDSAKIHQVLINLLDNASKFTPRFGAIEIKGEPFFWDRRLTRERRAGVLERRRTARPEPNCYRVDVHDSGSGIPPQYLEKIFEEYTSYFGGSDRSGGGLGLAICRSIIEAHEGRIWAENSEEGATLSFVLPYTHEHDCPICARGGSQRRIPG